MGYPTGADGANFGSPIRVDNPRSKRNSHEQKSKKTAVEKGRIAARNPDSHRGKENGERPAFGHTLQ